MNNSTIKKGTVFSIIYKNSTNVVCRYLLAQISFDKFSLINLSNGNRMFDNLLTTKRSGRDPFFLSDIQEYVGSDYKIFEISNTNTELI
jgi:hypothetical protein